MSLDRISPALVGGAATIVALAQDLNLGAVAGGITAVGVAVGAGIWSISSNRTKAYQNQQKAELDTWRDREMARIEMQKKEDEANKESLSSQLKSLQRSIDETNTRLEDARMTNQALKDLVDGLKQRLEDANGKLHVLNNEANAKNLLHEEEKMALEKIRKELMEKLDQQQAENVTLSGKLAETMQQTKAQAESNAARLDALAPEPNT